MEDPLHRTCARFSGIVFVVQAPDLQLDINPVIRIRGKDFDSRVKIEVAFVDFRPRQIQKVLTFARTRINILARVSAFNVVLAVDD